MKRIYEGDEQERRRQSVAAYRARDPERSRENWRNYKRRKVEAMAGRTRPLRCEICHEERRICYDHDHKTGEFRGFICDLCNLILGKVKDDVHHLLALAEYLDAHEGGHDHRFADDIRDLL